MRLRYLSAAALTALLATGGSALAVPGFTATPFTARFTTNAPGDIVMPGNTLLTCPTGAGGCAAAQAGGAAQNNGFDMGYVDVDADSGTFNSSSATVALPAGAQVLFAGLYWGGSRVHGTNGTDAPSAADSTTVSFKAPGASGYSSVTGAVIGANTGGDLAYQAFSDVTSQVAAAGNGVYTVGNVQLSTGQNTFGGWSLVIAYRDDADTTRNLTVFDGYEVVRTSPSSDATKTITVSGMHAPPTGAVTARIGVIAYDGDRGYTGDSLDLNGQAVSDASHPADDIFNSSVANLGTAVAGRNPSYDNLLGFDSSIFTAPAGSVANNATSASIHLTTGDETYYPGVVTSAIDLFAPKLVVTKTATDVDGGELRPGDTVQYTVGITNNGTDDASQVVLDDPLPAGTTYVPGSLKVSPEPGPLAPTADAALTDRTGDDSGDVQDGHVRVRVGLGATSAQGGVVATTATTTITFRVVLDASLAVGSRVTNTASVAYNGRTTGAALAGAGAAVAVSVTAPKLTPTPVTPAPTPTTPTPTPVTATPKLKITIAGTDHVVKGQTGTYTVTVKSVGQVTAEDVALRIPVPQGMVVKSMPKGFRLVKGALVGPAGDMVPGASRKFVMAFTAAATVSRKNTVSASAAVANGATQTVKDTTPVRVTVPPKKVLPAVTG